MREAAERDAVRAAVLRGDPVIMGEVVERVARAICAADNHEWPADDYNGRAQKRAFAKMARAAIEAMRDPPSVVIDAMDRPPPGRLTVHGWEMWNAGIDAALSETRKG